MAGSRQTGSAGGSGGGRQGKGQGTRSTRAKKKAEGGSTPGGGTTPGKTSGETRREEAPKTTVAAGGSDAVVSSAAAAAAAGEKREAAAASAEAESPGTDESAPATAGGSPIPPRSPAGPGAGEERGPARSGWQVPLLGGLVGGAVVALIVLYLAPSGPPDPRLTARLDETTARIAELEKGLGDRIAAIEENGAAVAGRIDDLASELGTFGERLASLEALPGRLDGLERRLDGLEGELERLRPLAAGLDELVERTTGLERRLDDVALALPAGGDITTPLAGELTDRLETLEGSSRELQAAVSRLERRLGEELGDLRQALARLDSEREELGGRIASLREELLTTRQELAKSVAGLDGRLREVAGRVDRLDGALAEFDDRLAGFGETLAELRRNGRELAERTTTLERRFAELRSARERAVGLVLAANSLSLAALEGGGLEQPLADIAALAGDDPTLQELVARLRPHADTGVPSLSLLRERFAALAPAMVGRRTGGDSVLEKTRSNLEALVTIRRRGEALDPTAAAVDRARNALAEGRVEEAVAALEPLAEAGNEAAREWVALARARLAALAAIAELDGYVRRLLVDTRSKS